MDLYENTDGTYTPRGKKGEMLFPVEKGGDKYEELIAEGAELILIPQATKTAHEQAEAISQAATDFASAIQPLVSGISQVERDTFERQEREAREWLVDNSAPVAFIRGLSESRGIELDILVAKIIIKADYYSSALAKALGEKHKAEDLL